MRIRILRNSIPVICAACLLQTGICQVYSGESQGLAGIRSISSGRDAMWHNVACLPVTEEFMLHAVSAMPFLLDGLVTSGIAAVYSFRDDNRIGARVHSIHTGAFSRHAIGLFYAKHLSEGTALGLTIDQLFERYGADKHAIPSYSIAFTHTLNSALSIGVLLIDPMPISTDTRGRGWFHAGGKWAIDRVNLYFELFKNSGSPLGTRWAIDYEPIDWIVVRLGIASRPTSVHVGLGIPLTSRFDVNLAVGYHTELGLTPTLSISYPGS